MSKIDAKQKIVPKNFDLLQRLITFSVRIIRVAESLPKTKTGNHIGGQLIRCGTSSAANYAEAQSAESRVDFVHKIKIVLKELRETQVWLMIIVDSSLINPHDRLVAVIQECDELISIFVKSVNTAAKTR